MEELEIAQLNQYFAEGWGEAKKKTLSYKLRVFAERKTRLELATTSLEGWSSTN